MDKIPDRRGLGRGLSALMADVKFDQAGGTAEPRRADTVVPVERLVPNPLQPRRDFPEAALQDLAASLRQKGIIQPLIVRPIPGSDSLEIVAGERRWLASKMAGKTTVPAIIRHASDEQAMEMTIVENLQRADLNPMEQARAYDLGRFTGAAVP